MLLTDMYRLNLFQKVLFLIHLPRLQFLLLLLRVEKLNLTM